MVNPSTLHENDAAMSSPNANTTPNFTPSDYIKFFGAGALAATLTHGVSFCCLTILDSLITWNHSSNSNTRTNVGRHAN